MERIQALGATNIIIKSVKPTEETQAAGSGGRGMSVLNYGLKYDDYDRLLATVPTIKKALPIREIRKQIRHLTHFIDGRVVGTTHDYAEFNQLEIDRGRFLTEADNERYQNYAVLAAGDGQGTLPLRGPDGPVGQARLRLLHGRRRDQGARQHRRGSAAASPGRISTRTSTSP